MTQNKQRDYFVYKLSGETEQKVRAFCESGYSLEHTNVPGTAPEDGVTVITRYGEPYADRAYKAYPTIICDETKTDFYMLCPRGYESEDHHFKPEDGHCLGAEDAQNFIDTPALRMLFKALPKGVAIPDNFSPEHHHFLLEDPFPSGPRTFLKLKGTAIQSYLDFTKKANAHYASLQNREVEIGVRLSKHFKQVVPERDYNIIVSVSKIERENQEVRIHCAFRAKADNAQFLDEAPQVSGLSIKRDDDYELPTGEEIPCFTVEPDLQSQVGLTLYMDMGVIQAGEPKPELKDFPDIERVITASNVDDVCDALRLGFIGEHYYISVPDHSLNLSDLPDGITPAQREGFWVFRNASEIAAGVNPPPPPEDMAHLAVDGPVVP